jgi:type IV pilus assembly protein PilW
MMAVRLPRPQRGMTLAELLVAITLGLFVVLAAGALLLSANAAWLAQQQAAEADDGGRYALDAIGRAVRQAAYGDWDQAALEAVLDDARPARLAGLDARSLAKNKPGIEDPLPGAVNDGDVLAVRFMGAGTPPDGDGTMLDCAGFAASRNEEGWSIFYVALSEQGEPELRCKYHGAGGWSSDAVVAGVDSFQVLYGLDTDEPRDGVPNRYVTASAIDALDAALVLDGASGPERERDLHRRTHWKRVATVQVALLLRGPRAAQDADRARVYDLFGPAYGAQFGATDQGTRLAEAVLAGQAPPRERRLFTTTVALRGGAR